jgi:hypothetical protein
MMVYAASTLGNHQCPLKMVAKFEAEVDMAVYDEMITFDLSTIAFWESNDTKFYKWLAERRKI